MVNKKKSDNKWLILLIVIVVLSLVVKLLSLNVLYSLRESQMSGSMANLKGELANSHYSFCVDQCHKTSYSGEQLTNCLKNCCEDECMLERMDCGYSPTHCNEEFRRCEHDCNNQFTSYPEPDTYWSRYW